MDPQPNDLQLWKSSASYVESDGVRVWQLYGVHFPSMLMLYRITLIEAGTTRTRLFELRRDDSGTWVRRYTQSSFQRELFCARTAMACGSKDARRRVEELQNDGNIWKEMPPRLMAEVEPAYQRFIQVGDVEIQAGIRQSWTDLEGTAGAREMEDGIKEVRVLSEMAEAVLDFVEIPEEIRPFVDGKAPLPKF
jgi:hypothetical protein